LRIFELFDPPVLDGLQAYIKTFNNKPTFQAQLDELDLTESEQKEVDDKFTCHVLFGVMNIPVSLNENFYDLSSLKNLKVDPLNGEPFIPQEIQSSRSKVNEMNAFIEDVTSRISNESQFGNHK